MRRECWKLGRAVRWSMANFQRPRFRSSTTITHCKSTHHHASVTRHFSSKSQEITEANDRCKGSVQIRTTGDGRGYGIFANRNFAPGERVIQSIATNSSDAPNSHSIQTGWKTHIAMDLPARFLNHMCDPNLQVELNQDDSYDFVARTKIEKGTEVGFDYETTEYQLSEPIQCGCGSPKCRKVLKGFRVSKEAILQAHGKEGISPYLLSTDD